MKLIKSRLPKELMRRFQSDIGASEFFSYVSNKVTIEQAIAVMGILHPDFIEREGGIFWTPNANKYDPKRYSMHGFKKNDSGELIKSTELKDIERYYNNFPVSQFFYKWEESIERQVVMVELGEDDYKLCHAFAEQLASYWYTELRRSYPTRSFKFEVADDILDEFGVCMTFWQE